MVGPAQRPDFGERGAGVEQRGRQCMAQQLGPLGGGVASCPLPPSSDDRADGDGVRKAALRGLHAAADSPGRPARAPMAERGPQRLSDVLGQGPPLPPAPFTADEQCAGRPIEGIDLHGSDCPWSKAQTRAQAHEGVIPLAWRCAVGTARQ